MSSMWIWGYVLAAVGQNSTMIQSSFKMDWGKVQNCPVVLQVKKRRLTTEASICDGMGLH